ncbi:hypothetical protein [Lichenihabitans psoromatis]|uniref:hypothetical protein n=1 Tax=Lichenihabitans psoromatis TaxID=2528642 RepID=UPI0010366641|nr:hypothetical protein [Lichenihabitans psoromatis]
MMAERRYTASKTKAQGRPGWSISFRHPLRNDTNGKPGLKMRRGLGTTDDAEAERLASEMNAILADPAWWNATKQSEAARLFSAPVVAAFYDEIQAGWPDPWAIREDRIPLPTADDGYSRVMLVGTTGAGKTSLLRHLIGSDPERDRFPSTSTAKTTVSDIEVVLADGGFSAVVTFFSEFWVRANLEECVADACSAVWERADAERIAERLLNHRDQRFRLTYTLGSWAAESHVVDENDWDFEPSVAAPPIEDERAIGDDERDANTRMLQSFVDRIRALSGRVAEALSLERDTDVLRLAGSERDEAQGVFEERLQDDDDFDALIHDIMDEIRRRFDGIRAGTLHHHQSGWPATWVLDEADRDAFIRQIRWFSSNYAPQFGRLLTPMVEGIRVRGPLFPTFTQSRPRLVLLDGQGLGHTPDVSASITTQITRRFADVDAILLVDNAQQPMQASALAVVRSAAASGHQQKLGIAFTHFDHVKGVNLPTFASKRAHVMASVANGLTALRDVLGAPIVRSIERSIDRQCFMLGALDQPSDKLPQGVKSELGRMLAFFETAIEPEPAIAVHPVYHPDGLILAVQGAARAFRRPWAARLGLGSHESVPKEHWARIRALNRRIAGEIGNEYDTLRPAADLLGRLTEEVSRYLDHPAAWEPRHPDEDEAEAVLSQIRRQVARDVTELAARRLIQEPLRDWRNAFEVSGKGSTFDRAQRISAIYERGAPIASTVVTETSADFIKDMRRLVYQAIRDCGGKLDVSSTL